MAKERDRYPLVKLAWTKTHEVHPSISPEAAYNAGASLICSTMYKLLKDHPNNKTLPFQAIESLLIETTGFLKEEKLHDAFVA